MKAKVKLTGEIVNVEPDGSMKLDCPAYITDNGRRFHAFSLEFEKKADWEQRRYEIAKEAMTAIMSNADFYEQVLDQSAARGQRQIQNSISEAAVIFADALIEELKKKG